MVHIRVDGNLNNSERKFACGIGPELPPGDKWVGSGEIGLHGMVTCPGCGGRTEPLGTPISELSGQPGQPGYEKFCQIAASWGHG